MTESTTVVVHVHCESATDFLDALSPRSTHFRDDPPNEWAFRGHGNDADYQLLPRSLRPDGTELLKALAGEVAADLVVTSNAQQIAVEIWALDRFLAGADAVGLPIPEDSSEMRSALSHISMKMQLAIHPAFAEVANDNDSWLHGYRRGHFDWPYGQFVPLMGLAQHYGVPTRLLDWTRSSAMAAYFAAADKNAKGLISVWAIKSPSLRVISGILRAGIAEKPSILFVNAARATNQRLHAQGGLFTMFSTPRIESAAAVDRTPVEELVSKFHSDWDVQLVHFTLPSDHCGHLLWLLAKEGVTASVAFPTYSGVVDALLEQVRWNDQAPAAARTDGESARA